MKGKRGRLLLWFFHPSLMQHVWKLSPSNMPGKFHPKEPHVQLVHRPGSSPLGMYLCNWPAPTDQEAELVKDALQLNLLVTQFVVIDRPLEVCLVVGTRKMLTRPLVAVARLWVATQSVHNTLPLCRQKVACDKLSWPLIWRSCHYHPWTGLSLQHDMYTCMTSRLSSVLLQNERVHVHIDY